MITLNTLNSLIDDILLTIRNNNISASEPINRTQIEQWINYYRARLIKEDIERNDKIDPAYIQYLDDIHLDETSTENEEDSNIVYKCKFIADIEIPKTIQTNNSNGILSITDSFGNEIQQMARVRITRQRNRKYTCNDYVAYLKGNKLYVDGPGDLEYINLAIIAEDPSNLGDCDFADKPYPIPSHKLWVLKQMIFQNELGVMLRMPTDNVNNSKNDLENIAIND